MDEADALAGALNGVSLGDVSSDYWTPADQRDLAEDILAAMREAGFAVEWVHPEPVDATRYTVDEIIPMHDDGYGPDGWVVLDMVREEEVASFLLSCPDARHHAYTLCADLNRMDSRLSSLAR